MLHIVIPAYNEEQRLPRTLRALRRFVTARRLDVRAGSRCWSSTTAAPTARLRSRWPRPRRRCRCASCAAPSRGKGAAVRAGLLASDADLVAFMDADGATDLTALDAAWHRVRSGADVVIGSRGLDGSVAEVRSCRTRTAGAAAYRRLARRLVPGVADTQCGFKVMRGGLARASPTTSSPRVSPSTSSCSSGCERPAPGSTRSP